MGSVSLVCLPPLVSPPRLPPPPTRQPVRRSHLSPPGGKNGQAVRDSATEKHRGNLGKHIGIYWEYSGFMDIFPLFLMVIDRRFQPETHGNLGLTHKYGDFTSENDEKCGPSPGPRPYGLVKNTFPSWLVIPVCHFESSDMMGMMGMVRLGEKRGLMEIIWDSHTRIRLDGDYFMWIIWLLLRFSCFFFNGG